MPLLPGTPGERISDLCNGRHISQKELAKRINMSASTIGKVERGQYNDNLSLSLLLDIADGLQIDVTLLTTFTDLEKRIWWESLS